MTVSVATLGFPRIGPRRELKFALESYWAGKSSLAELQAAAAGLRALNWTRQKALGADILPSNDFSLYDHVLDTSALIGAVPPRYDWTGESVDPDLYFAMARGAQGGAGHAVCGQAHDTTAQEMTKWFDTNYHFMVPELTAGQTFKIASTKIFDEFEEARALGYSDPPRPARPRLLPDARQGARRSNRSRSCRSFSTPTPTSSRVSPAPAPSGCRSTSPASSSTSTMRQRTAFARAYARLATRGPEADADHLLRRPRRQSGSCRRRCRSTASTSTWSAPPTSSSPRSPGSSRTSCSRSG